MEARRETPQNEFDIRLATECIKSFSAATGLGCTLSDVNGKILGEVGCGYRSCELCRISGKGSGTRCTEVHIYGMDEAERFGGRYIYFCPAGMAFFASPILDQLGCVAKITTGPFLMVDREEFEFLELRQTLALEGDALEKAKKLVETIPYVEPDKVTPLSNMLYFSVGFLSNVWKTSQLLESQAADAIQSAIGEYISEVKSDGQNLPYPYETEKFLMHSITAYDRESAGKALNDLLGYIFFSCGGDIQRIKSMVYDLLVLMSRAAVEGGAPAESTLKMNHRYLQQLQSFQDIDQLCVWLTRTMNRFMSNTFGLRDIKHLDVVHKTVQFVRQHFTEKLTVEQAAANVYLSPSYFSKVFKQDMGQSFGSYLNQVRIEKSKELLQDKRNRIIDVAVTVGFDDQSYFTKVFKRITGVSPNCYRESLGRV